MMTHRVIIITIFFLAGYGLMAQEDDYRVEKSKRISPKECKSYVKYAVKKCDKLKSKIKKSTDHALDRYNKLEDVALQKVCDFNEGQAESLLRNSIYAHRRLEGSIERSHEKRNHDSGPVLSRLSAINKNIESLVSSDSTSKNVKGSCQCAGLSDLRRSQEELRKELDRAEKVKDYIHERNIYIHKVFESYPDAKLNLASLEKLDFYFNESLKENLSIFSDQSALEEKILRFLSPSLQGLRPELLPILNHNAANASASNTSVPMSVLISKINQSLKSSPQLLKFMNGDLENVGLNNKEKVKQDLKIQGEQIGTISKPDSLLSQTRDGKKEDKNKKSWTPNPLKEKRLRDRLIYGTNLEPVRSNQWLPSGLNLSFQLGFQVTPKLNIGAGLGHQFAFSLQRLSVENSSLNANSRKSINLRSFCEWKIKKHVFIQSNYELNNYFNSYSSLQFPFSSEISNQPSWLGGLKIRRPSSKKANQTIEVLYDFLHDQNGRQALVIRFGIEFLPKHAYKNLNH